MDLGTLCIIVLVALFFVDEVTRPLAFAVVGTVAGLAAVTALVYYLR